MDFNYSFLSNFFSGGWLLQTKESEKNILGRKKIKALLTTMAKIHCYIFGNFKLNN